MKVNIVLLTIFTCCSLSLAKGDHCFKETDRKDIEAYKFNRDAHKVTERSDRAQIKGLLREHSELEVVGIEFCVNEHGHLSNIGIRLGGQGLVWIDL